MDNCKIALVKEKPARRPTAASEFYLSCALDRYARVNWSVKLVEIRLSCIVVYCGRDEKAAGGLQDIVITFLAVWSL